MPTERRLVTVLFADVVNSTAMAFERDPEVVRGVMSRYFARMREIAAAHGGSVEKFIGDAVMVVFGVPRLHADDAERGVRAALAMRDAVDGLNAELAVDLQVRFAVATGETATDPEARGQFLVTGDVVNVAAKLQQAAQGREVLVEAAAERMTRNAVEYERRGPIAIAGRSTPIEAFVALGARALHPESEVTPRLSAELVDRHHELGLIGELLKWVANERRARHLTIVGGQASGSRVSHGMR